MNYSMNYTMVSGLSTTFTVVVFCFAFHHEKYNLGWDADELYVSFPITETSIVSKPINPFKPADDKKDGLCMYM